MLSGFTAITSTNAKILILGSMPSQTSLDEHQYYAHPRNSFWFIIESLFSGHSQLSYQQRIRLLQDNNIAVWDVLKNCIRAGSLDSAIEQQSIITNDFNSFYRKYPSIKYVFFNGTKSETEYNKRVLPTLTTQFSHLKTTRLPSTSPAMAKLNPNEKLEYWSIIREYLLKPDQSTNYQIQK